MRRGVPFDSALAQGLGTLPELDRRLAHELAAGVLRQAAALDALLAPQITRGLASVEPAILDVLRLGSYQLRHLDRVPAHAAVATAVELAHEVAGEYRRGFVNAVLRKVAALGREVVASGERDDVTRLSEQWSHPAWLVARWLARFGRAETEALLDWNNSHPPLVVQPARTSAGDLERLLKDAGIATSPTPFGAGLVVAATRPELLPGYDGGAFFVQDPAQALVARYASIAPGAVVYDACAAPGGKTLGLAQQARTVVAADIARRRIPRLRENIARAGRGNEQVIVADALHPPVRSVAAYLLDAPCLGTGTFARHPDARLRVSEAALGRLALEQARLLDAAAERMAVGGVLTYATCSLEPEEDELQVTAFLARHPTFRRQPPVDFPTELCTSAGDLLLLPQRHGMDGAYAARLVRG